MKTCRRKWWTAPKAVTLQALISALVAVDMKPSKEALALMQEEEAGGGGAATVL